jgi:hypothetical protein
MFSAMKPISLPAKFDGEHIRLEADYALKRDARLLVIVLPEGKTEDAALREYWQQLSMAALSRAYGPEEPEYRLDMVRDPNADYGDR